MILLHLFIAISSISAIFCDDNFPLVQTHLGKIKGHLKKSYTGRKYEAFEGIPYAQPPIGERRFQVS